MVNNCYINNQLMQFFSSDPFCHRPWLVDIADDMNPYVVIKKARQLGLTELALRKVFYFLTLMRCTAVYTMPVKDKMFEISRERIEPLKFEWGDRRFSKKVADRLIGWSSLQYKHVQPLYGGGRSTLLLQSAWKESGEVSGESTAADILCLDEYDKMNPRVKAAFKESLASSRLGYSYLFSTPTYPKRGIDAEYEASDKKRYVYRCAHCGKRQYLTRLNIQQCKGSSSLISRLEQGDRSIKIEPGTFRLACNKCGKTLVHQDMQGEWVAEHPERDVSGYALSQLNCAHISVDNIMFSLAEGLESWYWYKLGEAYLGEGGRLDKDWVYTLVDSTFKHYKNVQEFKKDYPYARIGVGCDWGKANWWIVKAKIPDRDNPVVLDAGVFFDIGEQEAINDAISSQKLIDIAKHWQADAVICDFGFGKGRNPKVYKEFGYKYYACDYGGQLNTALPAFGKNPPMPGKSLPVVHVDRTSAVKRVMADVRYAALAFSPAINKDILQFIDQHYCNIVIRVYSDKGRNSSSSDIQEEAVDTGPDHFVHAMVYADIALELTKKMNTLVGSLDGNYAAGIAQNIGDKRKDLPVMAKEQMLMQGITQGFVPIAQQIITGDELLDELEVLGIGDDDLQWHIEGGHVICDR